MTSKTVTSDSAHKATQEKNPAKPLLTPLTVLCVVDSGCEEACVLELARWTKRKPKIYANVISIDVTLQDALVFAYQLQTPRRILIQLIKPLKSLEELDTTTLQKDVVDRFFSENATFKAECDLLELTLLHRNEKNDVMGETENDEETTEIDSDEEEIDDADGNEEDSDEEENSEDAPEHSNNHTQSRLTTQEVVETIGGWAHDQLHRTVKLSNPDIIIYGMKTPEHLFVGIDLVGNTLARREFRIMLSRRSLKSTIAAATALYSGAKEKEIIFDPQGDDGSIMIEAALLLTSTSPRQFEKRFSFEKFPILQGLDLRTWRVEQDKKQHDIPNKIIAYGMNLHEMKAIRTNAKLAGVEKHMHITKVTVDWIDLKQEEGSVDRIITAPIPSGKSVSPQQTVKWNNDLFYQAEFVLKKGKTITCITEKPHELMQSAQKYNFAEKDRKDTLMGKRLMTIVTFTNTKRKEEKE